MPTMEPKGIQSVEIASQLLDALETARLPLSLTDLGSRAGLSPSKARNYLVSLMRVGLVQQDPASGRYDLGPATLRLGLAALGRIDVLQIAFDEMKRRQTEIGETLFLAVWGNKGPAIVRWLEGERQTTVEVRTGSVLPVTRSATGWAFLAYMPETATAPVVAAERAEEPVPKAKLAARLRAVRKHGLSIIDGDLLPGIAGLCAPILDHEERIRAAVTAIGRRGALDVGYDGPLASSLRALRAAVERQIGVTPPPA